jgi:hypothetical protein
VAEFEFRGGALRGSRLVLYAGRVQHHGGDVLETVPLAQLAAVRVAFAREPAKLAWAIALAAAGLALLWGASPLEAWAQAKAAGVLEVASGVSPILRAALAGLAATARLMPPAAVALEAAAALLAGLYWWGLSTLTLCFAATEREFVVRGRSRLLFEFAEGLSERIGSPGR